MMPVIRISQNTWDRLKTHAIPLEDSPDDIVNRALDALDVSMGRHRIQTEMAAQKPALNASGRGKKLPQRDFRLPLLETLYELGGGGSTHEIRALMETEMKPHLNPADYEPVSSGDPRWWNAVCWERNGLVKDGLLRADSQRGVWELSDKGIDFIAKEVGYVAIMPFEIRVDGKKIAFKKGQDIPMSLLDKSVSEGWNKKLVKKRSISC
ncbi:hypothetical protein CU048_04270 [Beijerinckiaceae bacterium]|nr:hypothetical protein CU048_04270 [Beijerinckiaceae bacterium]